MKKLMRGLLVGILAVLGLVQTGCPDTSPGQRAPAIRAHGPVAK